MRYIDLSNDEFRQTIVDKQENLYLGHTSAVLLYDKTIFLAYPTSHGRGTVILKRSDDGGLTWSERLSVPDSWDTCLQVPTLFNTFDKENGLMLMITGLYPIRYSISRDRGKQWSQLSPIGEFGGNVSFSDMIRLDNGDYIAFFHDDGRYINGGKDVKLIVEKLTSENNAKYKIDIYKETWDNESNSWRNKTLYITSNLNNEKDLTWNKCEIIYESYSANKSVEYTSKIYKTISKDGCLTFEKPIEILSHPIGFLAEPAAVFSPDKKQIALIMRENTRKYNSFISLSNDNCKTWSAPLEMIKELTGDRHTIKQISDGRLAICFRDMQKDSIFFGDWVMWVGSYYDLINNKQGDYKFRLKQNFSEHVGDCGYTGLIVLPDDTIVSITYGHWIYNESPYIISVRIKLNEFDNP